VEFVDCVKAFDYVETHSVLEALQEQGINSNYTKLIKGIYPHESTTDCLYKDSNKIKIKREVREGVTMSPKLFIAWLENTFRTIDWTQKGITINGEKLNHLRFADDIILTAQTVKDNEVMLQRLDNASRKCGRKMNKRKRRSWQEPQEQPSQYMFT